MKRLFIPIWLLGLVCLFQFSCSDEDVPIIGNPDNPVEITDFAGRYTATIVEYTFDEISQDVSKYFYELQITINKDQSCCNINGCNSWVTMCDWINSNEGYSNYFMNKDSGGVLFFKILDIQGAKLIMEVKNKTPEFKLFPDEAREGIYKITFVAI